MYVAVCVYAIQCVLVSCRACPELEISEQLDTVTMCSVFRHYCGYEEHIVGPSYFGQISNTIILSINGLFCLVREVCSLLRWPQARQLAMLTTETTTSSFKKSGLGQYKPTTNAPDDLNPVVSLMPRLLERERK